MTHHHPQNTESQDARRHEENRAEHPYRKEHGNHAAKHRKVSKKKG